MISAEVGSQLSGFSFGHLIVGKIPPDQVGRRSVIIYEVEEVSRHSVLNSRSV
jgi:hypothetical protein